MIRLFYVCLFIASIHALAEEPEVVVWTAGPAESAKALFAPGTRVRVLSNDEQAKRNKRSGYLPPAERDAVFRKVGIETKVSSLDELDKDVLILTARDYSIPSLKSDFPMLSEQQLIRLKKELRKSK